VLGSGETFPVISRIEKRIVLVAKSLLVTTSHQGRAGGTAKRVTDVAIGADYALAGKTVQVRGWNIPATMESDIRVPVVIGNDEEHIGELVRFALPEGALHPGGMDRQ
jgi:hypothetical protein